MTFSSYSFFLDYNESVYSTMPLHLLFVTFRTWIRRSWSLRQAELGVRQWQQHQLLMSNKSMLFSLMWYVFIQTMLLNGDIYTVKSIFILFFFVYVQIRVSEAYGLRFPREFGILVKQLLYFDRYTRLLAPDLNVLDDERIMISTRKDDYRRYQVQLQITPV